MVSLRDFGVTSEGEFEKKYGTTLEGYREQEQLRQFKTQYPGEFSSAKADLQKQLILSGKQNIQETEFGFTYTDPQTGSRSTGITEPFRPTQRTFGQTGIGITPMPLEPEVKETRLSGYRLAEKAPEEFTRRQGIFTSEKPQVNEMVKDYYYTPPTREEANILKRKEVEERIRGMGRAGIEGLAFGGLFGLAGPVVGGAATGVSFGLTGVGLLSRAGLFGRYEAIGSILGAFSGETGRKVRESPIAQGALGIGNIIFEGIPEMMVGGFEQTIKETPEQIIPAIAGGIAGAEIAADIRAAIGNPFKGLGRRGVEFVDERLGKISTKLATERGEFGGTPVVGKAGRTERFVNALKEETEDIIRGMNIREAPPASELSELQGLSKLLQTKDIAERGLAITGPKIRFKTPSELGASLTSVKTTPKFELRTSVALTGIGAGLFSTSTRKKQVEKFPKPGKPRFVVGFKGVEGFKFDVDQRLRFGVDVKVGQREKQRYGLANFYVSDTLLEEVDITPGPPTPKPPKAPTGRRGIGGGLFDLELPRLKKPQISQKGKTNLAKKRSYRPSVGAILLNLKSPKPPKGFELGIGLRPIISSGRGKKRAKKTKRKTR